MVYRQRVAERDVRARRTVGPPRRTTNFRDVATKFRKQRRATRPEPEASLAAKELRGGGVAGPIAAKQGPASGWEAPLHDELRRSFVSLFRPAVPEQKLREWYAALEKKIQWDRPKVGQRILPRNASWLVMKGCTCEYKYSGTSWPANEMDQFFLDITADICKTCGIKSMPNSCNANLYEDGLQSVGWHADDEPFFDATNRDALILSLSLGATRTFEVCPNDDPDDITQLVLEDGDICTMEGLMQKHYKHRVSKDGRAKGPRINLTWRWIVKHDFDCPRRDKPGGEQEVPVDADGYMSRGGPKTARRGRAERSLEGNQRGQTGGQPVTRRRRALEVEPKRPQEAFSVEEREKQAQRAKRFGFGLGGLAAVLRPRSKTIEKPTVVVDVNDKEEPKVERQQRARSTDVAANASEKRKRDTGLDDDHASKKRVRESRFAELQIARIRGVGDSSTGESANTSEKRKRDTGVDDDRLKQREDRFAGRGVGACSSNVVAVGQKSESSKPPATAASLTKSAEPSGKTGAVAETEEEKKRKKRMERFGTQ